jgi:sugar phosphate isomerase/epimerase
MPNHVVVSTLNWSRNSLERAVANVAALEFGQIDLALHEGQAHINPSNLVAGPDRVQREADRLRDMIARRGMKRVAALDVALGPDDLVDQQRRLAAVCDLARALDVPVMTLAAGPWGSPLVQEAERLRELLPIAQERGMQLAVPTHREQVTAMADAAVRLCELVPGLGLTLDPSHLVAGPNRGERYTALLPLTRLVHLRDATPEHLQVPPGTGVIDFGALVAGLHKLGYAGKFAITYPDTVPTTVLTDGSADTSENVIRMRDVFVAAERAHGIVRTP